MRVCYCPGMPLITVSCNCCGAPLKVNDEVRFVTCQFCNTQLEVTHSESAVFTRQINRIAEQTTQLAQDVEVLKLQNELEMLDRGMQVGTAPGSANSSVAGGMVALVFSIVFAIVCFAIASAAGQAGAPGFFALVPVAMGVLALVGGVVGFGKAVSNSGRQDSALSRRDELLRRLEELRLQRGSDASQKSGD